MGGSKISMKRATTAMVKMVLYIIMIILIVMLSYAIIMAVRGAGTSGYYQTILGGGP